MDIEILLVADAIKETQTVVPLPQNTNLRQPSIAPVQSKPRRMLRHHSPHPAAERVSSGAFLELLCGSGSLGN